tara:strand:+ start:328 stop:1248 length:921 start_codon:yes stop_codon:yes gene_type:complete
MSDTKPKVSLGIPLYNESEFLEETIISLLNQSYKDIEIVAIDNNSSDDSFKILQKYSKKDKRLKIYKNKSNIGQSANFNLVFEKSEGEYFSWIGAHDKYERDYVEKLLNKFKKNQNISVAFSNVSNIDKNGNYINQEKNIGFELKNKSSLFRLLKLPWVIKGSGDIVMGMYKKDLLGKTTLFSKGVMWPDVFLIHQVSKLGKVVKEKESLRNRRYFRSDEEDFNNWEEKYIKQTERYRSSAQTGSNKPSLPLRLPVLFLSWKILFEMGIKKIYNPINLFVSLYLFINFTLKRKHAMWIDLKRVFKN